MTKKPDTPETPAPVVRRSKDVVPAGRSQMQALQAKFKAAREASGDVEKAPSRPTSKGRRY